MANEPVFRMKFKIDPKDPDFYINTADDEICVEGIRDYFDLPEVPPKVIWFLIYRKPRANAVHFSVTTYGIVRCVEKTIGPYSYTPSLSCVNKSTGFKIAKKIDSTVVVRNDGRWNEKLMAVPIDGHAEIHFHH